MTPSLTVACLWVLPSNGQKSRHYGVEYVAKLRAMVARHLPIPHRFVCLTDRPDQVPEGVEPISVEPLGRSATRRWWTKLRLFDPAMPFCRRVLYLDLDVLVTGDLSPIARMPAPFAAVPDSAPGWLGKGDRTVVKRYNSSVMVWDHGTMGHVLRDWSPDVTGRLWSDQDWLAERIPDGALFPAGWFRRVSAGPPPWPADTKVVLCIKPKNAKAAKQWPWFAELWG